MIIGTNLQGYIDSDYKNLSVDAESIEVPSPPKDDSHITRMELEALEQIIQEAKLPREIMRVADRDPLRLFYSVAKKKGLDPLEEEAQRWADDWTKLSFEYKLKFKRRRPYEVKKEHDIDFVVNKSDTTESPSYPSGHAMMGYGVAEFYKDKYPLMADEWDNVADIIAYSRLQRGVHYPSDVEASKKIVERATDLVKEGSYARQMLRHGGRLTKRRAARKLVRKPKLAPTTTAPATAAPATTAPATPQTLGQRAKSWGSSVGNFASQNPMQTTAIAGATGVGGFLGAKKLMQPKPTTQMPKFGSLGHLEHRRSERAKFMSKEDLASLEKKVRSSKDLPEGANYITLPHGRKGVVRTEEGKSHLATILDARMRPPGRDISSKVKTAAEKLRLYHGSPRDLETLEPRQPNKGTWGEHGLYGTPNQLVAALYAIARNDSKGSWGVLPDGRLIARDKKELNPEGYVYEYDSDDYITPPEDDPGIGYVSQSSPEILSKEKVYLDNLRDSITRVDDRDKFLEYFKKTSNLKKNASDLSVLTAVPTQNLKHILVTGHSGAGITKTAKTRFIKMLENLVAKGPRDKALSLLRRAEASEGVGSYAGREIKGLTDKVLGKGGQGYVQETFYGGKMVPFKKRYQARLPSYERRLRYSNPEEYSRILSTENKKVVKGLEEEAANSVNIAKVVREDKDLSRLVQTPEYYAANAINPGLVGNSSSAIQSELRHLRSIPKNRITHNQQGRLKHLERSINSPTLGSHQGIPMSRVDIRGAQGTAYNPTAGGGRGAEVKGQYLSRGERLKQDQRAYKALDILENRYGYHLPDHSPAISTSTTGVVNNTLPSTVGKPMLIDFGIVSKARPLKQQVPQGVTNKSLYSKALAKSPRQLTPRVVGRDFVGMYKDKFSKTSSAKEQLRHILVTGHSGAGKTTYARQLAEELGMPLHELDPRAKDVLAQDYPEHEGIGWPGDLSERVVREALSLDTPHVIEGTQIHDVPDLGVDLRRILIDTPVDRVVEQRAYREYERRKLKNKSYRPIEGHRDAARKLIDYYRESIDNFRGLPGVESIIPEVKQASLEAQFQPDLTPDDLKALGVYDQVYGDAPSEASMKEWPEHWINKQDPLGWLQWYDRYSGGRRTDDDDRQMKRWKSFKARHLAQYLKKPTPRRAAALRNWGIDVEKY